MEDQTAGLKVEMEEQRRISFMAGLLMGDPTVRKLLESFVKGVVIVSAEGRIILVNKWAERLFGYSMEELVGESLSILIPDEKREVHEKHLRSFFTSPRIRPSGLGIDLTGKRKDGTEIPVEVSVSFLEMETGETVGIAFVSDISSWKKAEDVLKEANERLDNFAQVVAHDLNSNIGQLVGACEMLEVSCDDLSEEEQKELLSEIASTGRKMSSIIKELLLFAHMDTVDVDIAPIQMMPLIQSALKRLRDRIRESGAEVSVGDVEAEAIGHAAWIEEVWYNYIGNAIAYGGTPPEIQIGCTEETNQVVFWIKDNGCGVPEESIPLLFNDKDDARKTIIKGHGMGLNIVKGIVEKMGGKVGIASTVGVGSTFTFSLPAKT